MYQFCGHKTTTQRYYVEQCRDTTLNSAVSRADIYGIIDRNSVHIVYIIDRNSSTRYEDTSTAAVVRASTPPPPSPQTKGTSHHQRPRPTTSNNSFECCCGWWGGGVGGGRSGGGGGGGSGVIVFENIEGVRVVQSAEA